MSTFNNIIHLILRFSELGQSEKFIQWLNTYPSSIWHETDVDESNNLNIMVQSDDGLSVYAAQLTRNIDNTEDDGTGWSHTIQKEQAFESGEIKLAQAQVATPVLEQTALTVDNIVAIRPVVDFYTSPSDLSWEIEISDNNKVATYLVKDQDNQKKISERSVEVLSADKEKLYEKIPPRNDWLTSDECHHLGQWRATAQQMTQGATTNAQRARRIWAGVRRLMKYDATIRHISEFTHSDNLTISNYGWKGICDEWAVVQITLLRALGIPATLKFLIWEDGSGGAGHACLEWKDGNRWRHMDALWNAFDDKSVYRANGAKNVTVMDATSPRDSRSTQPAWGIPDRTGDQKFHPYGDFIITPSYPGNRRSGYSS